MPRTDNKMVHELKKRLDGAAKNAIFDVRGAGRKSDGVLHLDHGSGHSGGWNWYFFDFSTHNYEAGAAVGDATKSAGNSDSSFVTTLLFFLLVTISSIATCFLFQNLIFKDWCFHGMKTYQNRWNRGTQLLQSIFEISFSLASGILAFQFSQGLIAVLASLCGVSMATIGSSFLLTCAVTSLMLGALALGVLAGNMAVVSLIRWWSPLGTGRGLKRMHSDFRSSVTLNELPSRQVEAGKTLQSLFIELSNRSPGEFRNALLDNKIDALRNLKCLINVAMKKQGKGNETLESLSSSLSSLIHTLKNGVSDLTSFTYNLKQVRVLVSKVYGNRELLGYKGVSDWSEFQYSTNLALNTLQHDVDRLTTNAKLPGSNAGCPGHGHQGHGHHGNNCGCCSPGKFVP
ncbi:MAG: hypothetical protein VX737_02460 [Pseudomonadota bacterium]|nr:hypothetical protein [Pseudomonadota bacterium]